MPKYALLNTVQLAGGKVVAGSTIDSDIQGTQYAQLLANGGQLIELPNAAIEAAQAVALKLQRRGATDAELAAIMTAAQAKEGGTGGGGLPPLRVVYDVPGGYLFDKTIYEEMGYTIITRTIVFAGGGGGGSGRKGADLSDAYGGSAGAGSGESYGEPVLLADFPEDLLFLIVGDGGPGGASQTVDDTDGVPGSVGQQSQFYYGGAIGSVMAGAGQGGRGGTNAVQATYPEVSKGGVGSILGLRGGAGGTIGGQGGGGYRSFDGSFPASTSELNFSDASAPLGICWAGGGGGGGGGRDAGGGGGGSGATGSPPSTRVAINFNAAQGGSGGGGPIGGAGANGYDSNTIAGGGGGGGGGGTSDIDSTGGDGGNGGLYGGGGGGGGGCTNGIGQSGKGGNGAPGVVVLLLS